MNINLQLSPTSIAEDFVVKAYEPQLDGSLSEVGSIAVPAPHASPTTVSFTGLDKVTHVIKTIGVTSAVEYHRYEKQPTADTINIFDYIRFKIGDGGTYTPVVNTVTYTNPIMIGFGADDYVAIREGFGPLFEGFQITNDPVGGGFSLIGVGDSFTADEQITIIPKPAQITTTVNDSVVGKQWGPTTLLADMYVDVTAATPYIPAHLRKLIRLSGPNAEYRFTSINVPPAGYIFRVTNFGSYGATTPLPKVSFVNAPAKYGNTTINQLYIPLYGACEFVWDGTIWNITMTTPPLVAAPTFYKSSLVVGDVVGNRNVNISIPNQGNTTYFVVLTVVSNGTGINDNDIIAVIKNKTALSFDVYFSDIGSQVQNITLEYCIINF